MSDDGTQAYKEDKYGTLKKVTIFCDKDNGEKFANIGRSQTVSIAKAVITCFCKPKPKDGKPYYIRHKDGNKSNCHKNNLEWALLHYQHNTSGSYDFTVGKDKYTVKSDGTVWKGKEQLKVSDEFDDRDVDLWDSISPNVIIDSKRVPMDDIMRKAGFIQGDNADLSRPVINHKDGDRWNFKEDNLEWCESDDERYQDYLEKVKEDRHKRRVELNPGKNLPNGW